jgi:type II secretory pathway component GspD/PulD (secretin)
VACGRDNRGGASDQSAEAPAKPDRSDAQSLRSTHGGTIVFFNRFGPASDPYLRRICTPRLNINQADSPPDVTAPARKRRTLAALGLAVAFAAPLCGARGASAQEIEEPAGKDVAAGQAPARLPAAAPAAAVVTPAAAPAQQQLIDLAKRQMDGGDYAAAQETLRQVRTASMPDAQRNQVIGAQAEAARSDEQRRIAEEQLRLGQEAQHKGLAVEAAQHFKTAANNRFADDAVRQEAREQVALAASAPAAKAAPVVPAGELTAGQHYELGKEYYQQDRYEEARRHFEVARGMGYKPGLFQDAPQKYLSRIEKTQQSIAAREAKAAGAATGGGKADAGEARRQAVALASQANGNGQAPEANGTGAGDPIQVDELRATANMDEVKRRQNMAEARRLVAAAREAQDQNDMRRARELYEQAVRLDPQNALAVQGLQEARRQLGELPAAADTPLTREQARIEAARTEIDYRFNDAIRRAQRASVNIANLQQPFRDTDLLEGRRAIEEAAVARNSNPALFTEQELTTYDTRLNEARVTLDRAEEARQQFLMQEQRRDELARFADAERVARAERQRTIRDLIRQSRELTDRHEYEEALGLIDQILEMDPRNDYAIGVRPLIQDALHFAEQRKWRERFSREFTETMNEAEEKKVPFNDILQYPDDWPNISALRDRTVAEERGERAEDQAVMAQLERPLPEVNFDGAGFTDVVDFLRDVSGANIFVNWKALEAAGIDRNAPVSARLRNIKLSKALTIILDSVSGGTVPLGYTIDDGVITISTGEDIDRNTVTRVYDIRDLIIDVPDFTDAPNFNLQSANDQSSQGGGGGGGGQGLFGNSQQNQRQPGEVEPGSRTRAEMIDEIIRLVTETVAPDSWRDAGGAVGAVRELQGQLIVTQTPENQRQLLRLLEQLRETRAIQVTIEARFLTVSRNYLEDIGFDFDFGFNLQNNGRRTFSPIVVNQNGAGSAPPDFTAVPSTGVPGGIGTGLSIDTFTPAIETGFTYLDDFQVNMLLRATQASRNASIVTAPRVTLFNGQRAYVLVATQRAYISDLNAQVGTGTGIFDPEISTVQSGVILDVSATVSADRKYVTMTLRPQLATLLQLAEFTFQVGANTDNTGGLFPQSDVPTGVVQQPEIQITEVRTTVSVPDGGTLLLGGQTLAGEIEMEQGVPILSKIPFLKRLFTNRSRAKDEQVLLILVKPQIIMQREVEAAQFPLLSNRGVGGGTQNALAPAPAR